MRPRPAPVGLLALLAPLAALAGCGGGAAPNGVAAKSPQQILAAAVSALRSAHSVHLKGTVGSGAQAITIDATSFSNGDLEGTIGQNGATAQVVKVGGTDYFKGPASFWTSSAATPSVAALLANRWISIPDGQTSTGIGTTFTMSALATSLTQDNGTITKGAASTIDGQPAISIESSNGGTLWIATTGTPYLLEATGSGAGSNKGEVTFTDWNRGTPPTPPAGAVAASSITVPSSGTTSTSVAGLTGGTGITGITGITGGTSGTGTGTTPGGSSGTTGGGTTGP